MLWELRPFALLVYSNNVPRKSQQDPEDASPSVPRAGTHFTHHNILLWHIRAKGDSVLQGGWWDGKEQACESLCLSSKACLGSLHSTPRGVSAPSGRMPICWYLSNWRIKWVTGSPLYPASSSDGWKPTLGLLNSWSHLGTSAPSLCSPAAWQSRREGERLGSEWEGYTGINLQIRFLGIKPRTRLRYCHWLTLNMLLQLRMLA